MPFWSWRRKSAAIANVLVVAALGLLGCWLWRRGEPRGATGVASYGDAAATFGTTANVLVASVLLWVTHYYAMLTKSLLGEAALEREDRMTQLLTARARDVGGHLDVVWWAKLPGQDVQYDVGLEGALLAQMQHGADHGKALRLTLINAGKLPARSVRGVAYEGTTTTVFHEFEAVPVLASGRRELFLRLNAEPPPLRLELEYDDDDSRRWRKYGSAGPLELLADPYAVAVNPTTAN